MDIQLQTSDEEEDGATERVCDIDCEMQGAM